MIIIENDASDKQRMSAMSNLQPQEALVRKFFERRNVQLFEGVRRERAVIADRMAAAGTLQTGAFVSAVTSAFVGGFEAFAHGLIKDTFDLLNRSGLAVDADAASWIKAQLDPFFETAATNMRSEAAQGRVLRDELRESVDRAMAKCLAEIKRDLQIDLDLALVTKAPAAAVIDEALRDPLLPLQNRRGLEQAFGALIEQADGPLCLVQFDIDHFKDVNDNQGGHAIGDEALLSISGAATSCVKGKGQAFRVGGDEFVLLLSNHTLQEGLAVAERFRREVNGAPRTSRNLTLSVSVGVAQYPDHADGLDGLLKAADAAMYDAKNRGRNLVRYFGEPEPTAATAVREVERKVPEAGELTQEERRMIRQNYFRDRVARCPRDEAVLDVEDTTSMGQKTRSIYVSCPLCGPVRGTRLRQDGARLSRVLLAPSARRESCER